MHRLSLQVITASVEQEHEHDHVWHILGNLQDCVQQINKLDNVKSICLLHQFQESDLMTAHPFWTLLLEDTNNAEMSSNSNIHKILETKTIEKVEKQVNKKEQPKLNKLMKQDSKEQKEPKPVNEVITKVIANEQTESALNKSSMIEQNAVEKEHSELRQMMEMTPSQPMDSNNAKSTVPAIMRRKIIVPRVTTDSRGYLVTEHIETWEEVPVEESEKEKPIQPTLLEPKKLTKQGSILSFFKRG